ncbi:MAG: T9SS type A sorting domain-containing protein [Flavobacteriales bacterium]
MLEPRTPINTPLPALLFGALVFLSSSALAQNGSHTTTAPAVWDALPLGFGGTDDQARGGASNVTCAGAVVNALAVGTPVVVTGDNSGAAQDPVFNALVVWEAFTTTQCADVTIGYCGTTPSFAVSLNTLAVGCPLTSIVYNSPANILPDACGDGNFTIRFPNLPAGTYYFPVLQGANAVGPYTLTFTATACTAVPPANANCSTAIELPSATECAPLAGNVANATAAGNTGIGCGNGDFADGAWYSFEATGSTYELTVAPSPEFNAHVEVFEGSCGSLTSIACSVGANFGVPTVAELTDLTIGETYFLRVNDWYAGSPVTTTFFICLELVPTVECPASAGTLTANDDDVCLIDGSATINATPNGDIDVPEGYSTLFFLTTGAEPVIVQGALTPSFVVNTAGTYTIHTLVYDDATLDLNGLVFGQTTAASIHAVLVQGGGDICASLDLVGAPIVVDECLPCAADAGTLEANASTVCLNNVNATMDAGHGEAPVVPEGFEVLYLLTTGEDLIIRQGALTPAFTVTAEGEYTMHTLVYDPTTLDLGEVTFGVTSGLDVNAQLVQGGGTVCAALDVAGAPVTVEVCTGLAEVVAGTWSISPNPSTGNFNLLGIEGAVTVQVIGSDGRSVHEHFATVQQGATLGIELPAGMARGLYMVRVLGATGTGVARLVLE